MHSVSKPLFWREINKKCNKSSFDNFFFSVNNQKTLLRIEKRQFLGNLYRQSCYEQKKYLKTAEKEQKTILHTTAVSM